jgi:hypothetical protein
VLGTAGALATVRLSTLRLPELIARATVRAVKVLAPTLEKAAKRKSPTATLTEPEALWEPTLNLIVDTVERTPPET